MKNTFVMCAGLLLAAILFSACAKPSLPSPATTTGLIRTGATAASYYGLQAYARKHPDDAKATASTVVAIIDGNITPFLNGNNANLSSAAFNTILKQEFVQLAPEIKAAITIAAGALDAFLPVPDANTTLTPEQLGYLRAFFTGLRDGSQSYLDGVPVAARKSIVSKLPGHWLRL